MGVDIREAGISVVASLLKRASFPGEYFIADTLSKLCAPSSGFLKGHVGSYLVKFDMRDDVQRHIYFGLYDRPLTRLLTFVLREGSVFYDVGANIGYFSLLASNIVGSAGSVHAFEPVPDNASRISEAVLSNEISNIKVNEIAVTDRSDKITLYIPETVTNTGWASVVPSLRRPRELTVTTTTIDEYVFEQSEDRAAGLPDLIKLDIEGSEPKALQGMARVMAASTAPDIVVEVNPFLLSRAGNTPSDILNPLRAHGYKLYLMLDRGVRDLDEGASFEHLTDIFATKRGTSPGHIS